MAEGLNQSEKPLDCCILICKIEGMVPESIGRYKIQGEIGRGMNAVCFDEAFPRHPTPTRL